MSTAVGLVYQPRLEKVAIEKKITILPGSRVVEAGPCVRMYVCVVRVLLPALLFRI